MFACAHVDVFVDACTRACWCVWCVSVLYRIRGTRESERARESEHEKERESQRERERERAKERAMEIVGAMGEETPTERER